MIILHPNFFIIPIKYSDDILEIKEINDKNINEEKERFFNLHNIYKELDEEALEVYLIGRRKSAI